MEKRPFNNTLQLLDVTGPAVTCQHLQRVRRQTFLGHVILGTHFRQYMVCKNCYILDPFP